jgi:phosphatidylserine/phosphatidylglycerophosphate/cardiolipin synthase-like enzyme
MKPLLLISILFAAFAVKAQSIYEIQGQAAQSPYNGQIVTTQGIVTAIYSNSYFIQDGDSVWTGLYIYDQTQSPTLGDSIQITGTIEEYYEMTEMKSVTELITLSSGNTVPDPIVLKTGNMEEKWESVLMRVEDASCTNTDLGYGEWEINDGSGTLVVNDLGIAYTPLLNVNYSITGPIDYSFSFFKIEPRTLDDIDQDLALFFTVNPFANNINKSGFDINWETNINASSYVEYGLTTAYELGQVFSTVSTTTHALTIENLKAGNIYFAKSYSISSENDTTPIYQGVYTTQSESSGAIFSYFNHEKVESTLKNSFTANIVDTIIMYIEKAEKSLDVTLYDLTNHAPQSDSSNYKLIQAINKVYDKGVKVRFITDDSPTNTALDSLNTSIPVLKGNTTGIMHNKFLIIDAETTENSWVVTGSTNWTYNNLFMDYNNMICIQDESLAKAYEMEFNEMWGTTNADPDLDNSKFGNEKTDNTPHYFNINSVPVELYFSPSDNTTSKIVSTIDNAETSIDFAMMVFTEDKLGTALVDAHERGIATSGIIDYVEYSGSEFDYLKNNGVEVYDYTNPDGTSWPDGTTLHHKFCIIDKAGTNPLVVTGTHNWSASAESKNDENTLIIYDKATAELFFEEYEFIKNEFVDDIPENLNSLNFTIYPNPSNGYIKANFDKVGIYQIAIYNTTGQQIQKFSTKGNSAEFNILEKGLFIIQITDGILQVQKKIVIL